MTESPAVPEALPVAGYQPTWLAPAAVKAWLRIPASDTAEDDLLASVCASAERYVERVRPEFADADGTPTYAPDAEVYQGAVMLAAREYRRRNSPAGIELLDGTTSFVSRWDPEIERALQIGDWAGPVIA